MSVLLDANGVSGLTRKTLDPAVEPWAARYALEDQFSSPTGEAELAYGAAILPARRHRTTLISHIEAMLHNVVEDQVLPFDGDAARVYPGISGTNRAASCPLSPANYQIAAAALIGRVQLGRHHRAGVQIHRVLGLVGQMRRAVLQFCMISYG